MYKYFILILLFITSCSTNKVVTNHGSYLIIEKSKELAINVSNKNDILNALGPPSSKSTFNENIWIYIERKKESTSIFTLGRKKLIKNNVLVVKLDNFGILKEKNIYDLNNYTDLKFSQTLTSQGYEKNSYVYNVLTSLRNKINAPITKKRTKK